jgi:hypothetical protein
VIFRGVFLLFFLHLPIASAHTDTCVKTVALLGNESASQPEVPREKVLEEISGLFSAALNDKVPMEFVLSLMRELAEREGTDAETVRREIEAIQVSPIEARKKAEEQRERRAGELAILHRDLEPYLEKIGRDHRRIIEKELILPHLIKPLSTGEVNFRFVGKHRFELGDESLGGESRRKMRAVAFGPKDDFGIGQVPVTQFLYFLAALSVEGVEPTPSNFRHGDEKVVLRLGGETYSFQPNHPVENITWYEATKHAERVSRLMGNSYTLPTEEQWEFANRAGSTSDYHFGDDGDLLPQYGWIWENSEGQTHSVGELLANAYQLYDTHGNVWEWTSTPTDESFSDDEGSDLLVRGGSSYNSAGYARSAYRPDGYPRTYRNGIIGVRLVSKGPGAAKGSTTFTLGATKRKTTRVRPSGLGE